MLKFKYHQPGTAPATLVVPEGARSVTPVITLIEYDAETLTERKISGLEELSDCVQNQKVSWINVDGLGDLDLLRALGKKFGLHPLALEDVLNTGQRPKFEPYDNHFFIVAQMIYRDATGRLANEQVSIFLGKNFVISIQEEAEKDVFDPVRIRIRNGKGLIRTGKGDYLVYALLDAVIDHFYPVLEEIGEAIDQMESRIFENPTKTAFRDLHDYKRSLLQLRRMAWPEREVVNSLLHDESGMITKQTKVFLRDAYDHTVQIMDLIETYRDITSGLVEMYLSTVSMRTNEIMRVLTVISAIFIPLTFIAGVYGMNFHTEAGRWNMPELLHPYGYVICVGAMLLIAVGELIFFRRKGWI
ncbi:MAG: magnesium and cobalt transport protein CorA [Verrucomicrobiales bacterium]|nr:magnesium and cobalt transport protein CorA [Verrucomicrobiales bacterium]